MISRDQGSAATGQTKFTLVKFTLGVKNEHVVWDGQGTITNTKDKGDICTGRTTGKQNNLIPNCLS